MPSILTRPMAIAAFSFAIAACAQPPGAPAKTAAPPDTTSEAATVPPVSPAKEAYVMSDAPTAAPERGPAIPASALRERILALIGSFQSLKDLKKENVERWLDIRMNPNPEADDGYMYLANTTESWLYRVDISHFSPKGSPATVEIFLSNGVDSSTDQKPTYCTLEFEPLAKELVAMGYERDKRAYYRGGDMSWGFSRENSSHRAGFGIGVYVYEVEDGSGPKRTCIKAFNIGGGPLHE